MQLALFDPHEPSPATRSPRTPPPRAADQRPVATPGAIAVVSRLEVPAPNAGDALDAKMEQYLRDARAERTLSAYRSDWEAFERWCAGAGELALPASTRTLARYLTHLAELGRKPGTIRRARIAVGQAHALVGAPRPDRDGRIRTLERGIGRRLGTREQGAAPLLVEDLERLVAASRAGDAPRDCRDRALLLIGFAAAYRAADLAALNVEHTFFDDLGVRILLPHSKEDQLRAGQWTRIPFATRSELCPVRALKAWIARAGRPQGPLFRVVRGAVIEAERISTRAVARTVQRLARRVGLQGDYSAHSLRAGLATSAYAHGALEREIQAHGRWKDRRSLDRYIHVTAVPGRPNVAACVLR